MLFSKGYPDRVAFFATLVRPCIYLPWLVELKGNYLLLDDEAFDNQLTVDIRNVKLTYDARHQTLAVAGDSSWGTPDVYAAHLGHPFKPFKPYFLQGRFVKNK